MESKKTSIVFTGDIGFDRYMTKKWEDKNLLSREVLDFFQSADHTVANVEGALLSTDGANTDAFFHCMDPKATCVLENIRADIWCIGNNHIMDAGEKGLTGTLKVAQDMGCQTVGAGLDLEGASRPVYLDEAGGIGILSLTYYAPCCPSATDTQAGVFRWNDMDTIASRIAQIKEKCRWCVVVCHGGEEFSCMPNPYTRDRYISFLELGADVVVGHHPHVPENYELFDNGKAIFYSLGNFIFDTDYQRAHLYTDHGILLKLCFTEEKMNFEAMGIRIVRGREQIEKAPLPAIFANVPAEEYKLLSPLGAKAFISEDQRKMIFMDPDQYTDATQEVWDAYFFSETPDGFCRGEHMDLNIVVPYARTAEEGAWKQSRLEPVKQYILSLL